jgi:hypothetical protein
MNQLPPDITALIAAERAAPDPSAALMNSVRSQVTQSVRHAPLGHAVRGLAIKLVVLAVVIAAGALVYYASHPFEGHAPTWAQPVEASSADITDTVELTQRESPVVAAVPTATFPTAARRIAANNTPAAPRADIARMLTTAWQRLSADEAAQALELVEQVEALDAQGPLEEERHALEVSALLALHRNDEARASAQLFVERYPQSIHAQLVRRALTNEGGRR